MTENATVSHSHTHALEATGLKKHYGPRNVVKGVSLAVKSGEVVGLLGKNGAGKTTTFYMVVGLVVADDGQIRLDGQDITHMPIYKRARMGLSYLPQEASVFRKLSVEDNVRETLSICDHAYIINEGEVLASGTPDELVNDQAVRKIYLGENFRM